MRMDTQGAAGARNPFVHMLSEKPMTLIMSLPQNDAALCRAAFDAGADVVKVHCNLTHHASKTGFLPFDEYAELFPRMLAEAKGPMGLVLGADVADVLRDMPKASALPFDFFSLYAHHVPPTLLSLPQALMAACGAGYAAGEVAEWEAVGARVLEASVIPQDGYGQPLSLRDLIAYRTLCRTTRLPVVVPTQRRVLPEDVPYLRDAGVRGLMIGAIVTGQRTDEVCRAIGAFRKAIDAL